MDFRSELPALYSTSYSFHFPLYTPLLHFPLSFPFIIQGHALRILPLLITHSSHLTPQSLPFSPFFNLWVYRMCQFDPWSFVVAYQQIADQS